MDESEIRPSGRWKNYVMGSGKELHGFWETYLREDRRRILFVLGHGFDPRMCLGLKEIIGLAGQERVEVFLVQLDEGTSSPSKIHIHETQDNLDLLHEIIGGMKDKIRAKTVSMRGPEGHRVGSWHAIDVLDDATTFAGFTDIIIDISAMPRTIYFPIVAKAMHILDQLSTIDHDCMPNLHILVAEDPLLDNQIRDDGAYEDATYVHPFDVVRDAHTRPKIWIPILGEGQGIQLDRICDLVNPSETCPVIPSPSADPRRGDKLVIEYRNLLFDRLGVDPRNFIYASERNPFEVYRQIRRTSFHYDDALRSLGGCEVSISALSSKLMSIGALLAAYELKQAFDRRISPLEIRVAHVEARGYTMRVQPRIDASAVTRAELVWLWIAGDCYGT